MIVTRCPFCGRTMAGEDYLRALRCPYCDGNIARYSVLVAAKFSAGVSVGFAVITYGYFHFGDGWAAASFTEKHGAIVANCMFMSMNVLSVVLQWLLREVLGFRRRHLEFLPASVVAVLFWTSALGLFVAARIVEWLDELWSM